MGRNRPSNWSTIRRKRLRQDDYTCQECGNTRDDADLEVHHRTPVSEGGSHELENLITLCRDCHLDAHGWEKNPKPRREFLTDREREVLVGEVTDVKNLSQYQSKIKYRLRHRTERLIEDVQLLEEVEPELAEKAKSVIQKTPERNQSGDLEARITKLEHQILDIENGDSA